MSTPSCLSVRAITAMGILSMFSPAAQAQQEFTYATNAGGVVITGYDCSKPVVTIPETLSNLPVISIGSGAFAWCTNLASVTIPGHIVSIGSRAFLGCPNLTNAAIAGSITNWETIDVGPVSEVSEAFAHCTNLVSVEIGDGLLNIPVSLFRGCSSLLRISIPDSVRTVGESAFENCAGLTNVTFGTNVSAIRNWAFAGCTKLTSVLIPPEVSAPSWWEAFSGCTNLASINVDPLNLLYSSSGGVVFDKTGRVLLRYPEGRLGSYIIPNNVELIQEAAFAGTLLTSVTISDTVTNIGRDAFNGCLNLNTISIGRGVTQLAPAAFAGCITLTTLSIPDNVIVIGNLSFSGCTSLVNLTIPASVTSIDSGAFSYCSSLTTVVVPSSVTNLGWYSFESCANLTGVYCQGNAPAGSANVFYRADGVTIYYLPGATGWGPTFCDRATAPWANPLIRAASATLTSEGFGFMVFWKPGASLVVEECRNLSTITWAAIRTNSAVDGSWHFVDPDWKLHTARFYRIRSH